MTMFCRSLALTVTVALTGCAAQAMQFGRPPVRDPISVAAVKYFSITKKKPWHRIGCTIDVAPAQGNEVRLTRGETVAWIMGNDCDAAKDLALVFYAKGRPKQGDGETIIDFEPAKDGVLQGRVRDIDMQGQPYRVFRYRIQIGTHSKDPEIIIF